MGGESYQPLPAIGLTRYSAADSYFVLMHPALKGHAGNPKLDAKP